MEVTLIFFLTCFHSQILKFLWYCFESSADFRSLIKKKNQSNEDYFKYKQVKSTGISSEKEASKPILIRVSNNAKMPKNKSSQTPSEHQSTQKNPQLLRTQKSRTQMLYVQVSK